jgi:pimeloyl-ACP methyl ester carboxylesterase
VAIAFTEHRVPRGRGSVHVRNLPGSGAAFVLLHGFPDNSHIYDDLIPHLVSAGRRTVTIDFAFAQMTSQLRDEIARNRARLVELRRSVVPLVLIWGRND